MKLDSVVLWTNWTRQLDQLVQLLSLIGQRTILEIGKVSNILFLIISDNFLCNK